MANAIATLSVMINADTSGFTESIEPTKRELASMRKLIRDTIPEQEAYSRQVKILGQMWEQNQISAEELDRAIATLDSRLSTNVKAQEDAAKAAQEKAAEEKRLQQIEEQRTKSAKSFIGALQSELNALTLTDKELRKLRYDQMQLTEAEREQAEAIHDKVAAIKAEREAREKANRVHDAQVVQEAPGLREQFSSEAMSRLGGTRMGGILGAAGPIAAGFVAAEMAIAGAQKAGQLFVGTIEAIGTTAVNAINRLDGIADSAQALGMEASALQQLQVAAKLADAPVDSLAQALGKMEVLIGDPPDEAVKMFDSLGLSIEKLRELKPDQQFRLVAKAISDLPDRPRQLAAINDLFGKGNRELVNIIDGFDGFQKQAERFTLTESQFSAVGEADTAFKRLGLTVDGIGSQLGAELAPALTDIADTVADFLSSDATQSTLLTGMVAIRDTLQEINDLAATLKQADIAGTTNNILKASSGKGFLLGTAAEMVFDPFAQQAAAEKQQRDLERQLRKQRDGAATGIAASIEVSNAELVQLEKERKAAQQTILDQEKRFADSMDKLRIERIDFVDEEAALTQRAIEAGAASQQQVDQYIAEIKAIQQLKKEKQDMADAERKRIEEEKRLAQSREQILQSLKTPFERAKDEMQRAIEAGLNATQIDAFGNKLIDGLLPKGNIGPVTGFQKGSREAVAFEQATARADRQAKLLQEIRDRLKPTLFDGAVQVEEVEL